MASDQAAASAAHEYLERHETDLVAQLAEWVRIPSVASDPDREQDVLRSANWLVDALRALGLEAGVEDAGGSPAVYAEWLVDPRLPTVLVYSHHDVRHAKAEEWTTAPFTPVRRDGRLQGRGTSDAKGQVLAHVWGLRAHLAENHDVPALNLKFLVEGEEENGSPHLASLLAEQAERFACDVIVFSDTIQWHTPAVVTSLRGMVSASLKITGPRRDVHSGTASGVTPNPIHVLVDVLSGLHDPDGRVATPDFYDPVDAPSNSRLEALRDLPFDDDSWLERTETGAITGEKGFTVPERLWVRPAVEVLSLLAGDPQGIPRAVIPSTAEATLSIRTVPGQTVAGVADRLRAFVDARMPGTVQYELTIDEQTGQEPYLTPEGPALDALKRAIGAGFETDSVGCMGNAGGGPADLLASTLDAPVLFLGTGLPEDHWHSSDESVDIRMLRTGAATIAHLWRDLGTLPIGELR